ncbi:hypothetical protein [Chitinophaga rhizosphaerae]|uniref:hypothetical protein n=1 Tax=Chitinophaga rhizosphaerae TaxID=1864947 RepID=UPI000F802ECC|nr:hypothetical protein [Chitinophaga rhizosphaerae]
MKGKDFIIYIEDNGVETPICYATDCVFDFQYSTRRIVDPTTRWRRFLADDITYTVQVPGVVVFRASVNWVKLKGWAEQGAELKWRASAYAVGGYSMSGSILITSLNFTSQMKDVIKFDMAATGTGMAKDVFQPIPADVFLADSSMARLFGCPDPYPVSLYWYNADGTSPGGVIGIAYNADDVINQFNSYPENQYFQLTGYTSGCDFSLLAEWDAPFVPSVVFASASPGLGLWTGTDNEGITPDPDTNELISPNYA